MPNLGHHHHLIKSLAAKAARPLSFLSGNYPNQEVWRGFARKKLFELLHYAPPRVGFAEEVSEVKKLGAYVRRKVWFSSSQYTRVSAYLLMPTTAQGKLPGVVCLHDHGGLYAWGKEKMVQTSADEHPALAEHKQRFYGGRSVADELAAAGFAVLAIDNFFFGDRRLKGVPEVDKLDLGTPEGLAEFEAIAARMEPVAALDLLQAGATMMGLAVWDAIRSVEFLTTVEGVDGRRIGCFGAFSGGLLALFLGGLYDLVRATCAAGWVTTLGDLVEHGVPGTQWSGFAVPGFYNFMDLPDIACLNIPRALMLMSLGKEQPFPSSSASEAFEKVHKVYGMAQCQDDFRGLVYPEATVNSKAMSDALQWFKRWL
jgi:dienelactone hydrolase